MTETRKTTLLILTYTNLLHFHQCLLKPPQTKKRSGTDVYSSYSLSSLISAAQGNAAFKAGKYAEAIGHYTAATLADPEDATFFLNRAAAYLKLSKYASPPS
jgi:tetratricopeptide (TPR) repeat protein